MASQQRAKYLSLIDSGINNIWSVSLPAHLESLNLHGNYIRHICNLSHLVRLVHLDLSANQISVIDGLERLGSLKTLNLSCNLITAVEGLSDLRSLERLNLSYNQIEDVSGLSVFSGSLYHLQCVALHGNKLRSASLLAQALKPVKTLHSLVLSQDGSGNPLCHTHGYEDELWLNLPQLEDINNFDRNGKLSKDVGSISDIPGLDGYLDFLLFSDQGCEDTDQPILITPKIDAVMEQFKQKYAQGLDTSSSASKSAFNSSSATSESGQHAKNMHKIFGEKEVTSLTDDQDVSSKLKIRPRMPSSGDDSEPVRDDVELSKSRTDHGKMSHPQWKKGKSNLASGKDKSSSDRQSTSCTRMGKNMKEQQRKNRQAVYTTRLSDREDGSPAPRTTSSLSLKKEQRRSGSADDRRGREEAETVYKDLLSTLETERERRWKAEQAARRLADKLKDLQLKGMEAETIKNSAMEATVQLKQAVLSEHESNLTLKNDVEKMQERKEAEKKQKVQEQRKRKKELSEEKEREHEISRLRSSLVEATEREEKSREALRAAEAALASKETDDMANRLHQTKKLQEAEQRASALSREADILRHSLDACKVKVQQLQETLASRENQQREELRTRYSLNSPQLEEIIKDRMTTAEKNFQTELVKQQEKVEQLSQQYSQLEDEFRYALQVEEARFREVKIEFEQENAENVENKQLLLVAQRKDESSTKMITELTALVKEQKGRIAELSQCKHEQSTSYKERIQALEESLDETRKQVAQIEVLRQTKSKLQATVQAQESVIEGLKAERKLWGQELAQQGASLSQDRGRLEAKIEVLNAERLSLKKQLEREVDTVKIKTKMVDDQTETIRKLKEALVERDETIKTTREENLSLQRSLEEQLAEHKAALDETRELLDRTAARKDELKQQIVDLQQELQESKVNHRWKEKSELIGHLEQQVTQMKNNWTQKEVKLTAERDAALQQVKQAVDKLKVADMAFRQQLDVKEAAFQEKMTQLELERQQEVLLANQKVAIVEDEMRILLRENEASKRTLENKMKKLTQALGDLQTDLI